VLRRDQVWFVEKDNCGASELVSLAEYKSGKEKHESVVKDYLAGKYGAIPNLMELM